ncbi:MAG: hypothetical protein U0105_27285 [Candidatus Obscuribacterales bacterium]|jgi:hypothetical protein
MSSSTGYWKRTALVIAVAMSQSYLVIPNMVQAADGAVRLAGQTLFVNSSASGGMTVEQRAETIQKNLDNALVATKDRTPASVNIVYVKGLPVITLGGYQVATVDADNAKAANTTPALLAQKWASAIRNALADTGSVDSYIGQLTGSFQSSAPAAAPYAPPANTAYAPPAQNYGGPPAGGFNGGGQPGGYGGPGPGAYGGGGGGYGQPGGGYPQGAYGDTFNRQTPAYQQPTMGGPPMRGRVVYAPAGLVIPVNLNTSISTDVARPGDLIQATVSQNVLLGDAQIPAGATVLGQVSEAKGGGLMGRAGLIQIKFNRLRTPDGVETPISAHIVGGIEKYSETGGDQSDTFRGETWKTKAGQAAIRGGIGAGTGAALGTAIGAIAAGSGRGAGRGAWSGAAIGGGVGVAQSVFLRRGKQVNIPSGLAMQLQLDAPVNVSVGGSMPPYTGAF